MYATRSKTAAAKTAASAAVKDVVPKIITPKITITVTGKHSLKNKYATQSDDDFQDKKLTQKLNELIEREKALNEREKKLAKREKKLAKREKALENAQEIELKKTKPITVIYTAKIRGEVPEFKKIGEFRDEKSAIVGVITWLIQTGHGGFEVSYLNDTLLFHDEDYDNYLSHDKECENELNENELIKYVAKKCKTWDDLRNVCHNYGNTYFEDDNGWFLNKI